MIREILLLGNPALYETSAAVEKEELASMLPVVTDLHDTLMQFRATYGAGRAIAAPQIGVQKRVLYMHIAEPVVFINPILDFPDTETMEVLDDCMSFPELYVRLTRRYRCIIRYKDMDWNDCELALTGDLSELLQHEYDHLDGILATMRALDGKSFFLKKGIAQARHGSVPL